MPIGQIKTACLPIGLAQKHLLPEPIGPSKNHSDYHASRPLPGVSNLTSEQYTQYANGICAEPFIRNYLLCPLDKQRDATRYANFCH